MKKTVNEIDNATTLLELDKFFQVSQEMYEKTGKQAKMIKCIVDEAWHQLLEDEKSYHEFCLNSVGSTLTHKEDKGHGEIDWVSMYHKKFGQLNEPWFTSSEGVFDSASFLKYKREGQIKASWDCTPA